MFSYTMVSRVLASHSAPGNPPLRGSMRKRRSRLPLAGLGLVLLIALGCAKPPPPPTVATAWTSSNGMIQIDTHGRGLLFVKPDHHLGRYDELLIEHVGFRYGDNQPWLSYREEDRISAMLSSVIQGQHDGDVRIANDAGPCVLAVSFFLTDLEIYDERHPAGSNVSIVSSFGEGTLIMELRDSDTGEPLTRFLQRRELGGGITTSGTNASLQRLGTVVSLAMRDMGNQLREITPAAIGGHGGSLCEGRLTRVAFGSR